MIFLYSFVLILFSVYSYSLIDVNLTLFSNRHWEWFRNLMVSFGYFHREISGVVYISFIIIFFLFHFYFLHRFKNLPVLKLALIVGGISLFSYPLISHDFFNYIFDAKILTFYHKNPYLFRPQDFPNDPWLRFLHWTHRTYPYGPTFLLLTLFPSYVAFNKFILNFLFFKILFVFFYILSVYFLSRINKKWAVIFATHPLIIIEGLVNAHNDLIGVAIALIGVCFLWRKKIFLARLLFLISAGIKFITLPIIIATKNNKWINKIMFASFICLMIYLFLTREIQPWYFLNFFTFLPFFERQLMLFTPFSVILVFSNYFYIRYGVINQQWQTFVKENLFFIFFILNAVFVFIKYFVFNKCKKTKASRTTLNF